MAALVLFLGACYLPVDAPRFQGAVMEAFRLVRWYARAHVLLCLVPAFFMAGAIGVFVSRSAVMKCLGPAAGKVLSYGVASVSGTVLAVCSCTVLPLFGGIYTRGAGLGPAIAFLYSGPAINVLAIVLTARVLGWQLGLARAVGAVAFSVVIGLLMHLFFLKEERNRSGQAQEARAGDEEPRGRPLWQLALCFLSMTGILVFANWARSGDARAVFLCCPDGLTSYRVEGRVLAQEPSAIRIVDSAGVTHEVARELLESYEEIPFDTVQNRIHAARWALVAALGAALAWMLLRWFRRDELAEWVGESWGFAKQMLPLLLTGVFASGLFFGRPGHDGLVPARWIEASVGAKPDVFLLLTGAAGGTWEPAIRALWPLWVNFFASMAGALMYFATLTEIPIVQGLTGAGMGPGPALALLLAGPALSLPSMLVISSIIGPRKTAAYVGLVVTMATLTGMGYGLLYPWPAMSK